jgi:hypothetical protein
MKFRIALLIALPLIASSCKKDSGPEVDNGCIERIYKDKNDHVINSANVSIVNKLFADNNIDNSNFRYNLYKHDSIQTQYPPYEKVDHKHVRVSEFAHGLRFIESDVIFNFTKDVLSYTTKKPVDVSKFDVIPRLSLPRLRKMFMEDVERNPPVASANYTDSCLNAEFGFYVIRGGENNADKIVKAWLVTGLNRSYPRAVYNDDGSRIYYDNGIRTFVY